MEYIKAKQGETSRLAEKCFKRGCENTFKQRTLIETRVVPLKIWIGLDPTIPVVIQTCQNISPRNFRDRGQSRMSGNDADLRSYVEEEDALDLFTDEEVLYL